MPRRNVDALVEEREDEHFSHIRSPCSDLKRCSLLQDLAGNTWRLGKTVGVGGFGEIFLAGEGPAKEVKTDTPYVAKVESHTSGPLFVEINCYLRIAKSHMIEEWKNKNKLEKLGMPHYIASGSHVHGNNKYRFLIIPRFETDLEGLLKIKKKFNIKTVLLIACQILDVLEYMHSTGYIHSDIKASNILIGCTSQDPQPSKITEILTPRTNRVNYFPGTARLRTYHKRSSRYKSILRPKATVNYCEITEDPEDIIDDKPTETLNTCEQKKQEEDTDQVYLVDFGLAAKYVGSDGQHKGNEHDERKAHAGTVLFCSRDAHNGVQTRRSDLESLAYNMIYWLTGSLPWYDDLEEPEVVSKKKQRCFTHLSMFLQSCFPFGCPKFLQIYFNYLNELQFDATPDYAYCKRLFIRSLKEYGYKNDRHFDFDNQEGWGRKQKKFKRSSSENRNKITLSVINRALFVGQHRLPLHSNNHSIIRPLLRKKAKARKLHRMMTWSKLLMNDPEVILKQAKNRERKVTESSDTGNILNINIETMNPTYAMLEVYNRCKERNGNTPQGRGDCSIESVDGYTPAMMAVYSKIKEREEMERAQRSHSARLSSRKGGRSSTTRKGRKRTTNSNKKGSPTKLRSSRSTVSDVKSEVGANHTTRKNKPILLKRTYSLRG